MKWYEKTLRKFGKKIVISAIFLTVLAFITFLWSYFLGESFIWKQIEPISYPNIFNWRFYSALAFVTLGSFLFSRGFWIFIYRISDSRKSYRKNKKDVWTLITLTTFGLTILAVKILNMIISTIFNISMFIVYLLPPTTVTVLLLSAVYYSCKKYFS